MVRPESAWAVWRFSSMAIAPALFSGSAYMKNDDIGFRRLLSAFRFSMAGLTTSYRLETAFRQEVWAAMVLIPLSFLLADTPLEWSLLVGSVLLLMIVELLNTGIELVVDRIGPDFHELSGRAKDVGSAAVLLCLLLVAVVWLGVALT